MKIIKYVIVSPVRNEDESIARTIESVISQTIRPIEWIIVNDGSTDRTKEIVEEYARLNSWIKLVNREDKGHRAGVGPAQAFNEGLGYISKEYEFIINLDGDVSFEPEYFKNIFSKFALNPRLGIASGKSFYLENGKKVLYRSADYSTMGPSKVYRKECFIDVGGKLAENICWDMIDDIKAQIKGWETRSYKDISFIHYKRIGIKQGNMIKTHMKSGQILYTFGYHPIFMIGKVIYRAIDKPYVIGSLAMMYGYLLSWIKRVRKYDDNELIEYLRKKQMERMKIKWF
ncbi:MAG: glycosyltransferase family A protein [Candidatus Omnitrophota bacterium]